MKSKFLQMGIVASTPVLLYGCMSTTSMMQDAYGSKKGDLPQLERAEFNTYKPVFLAKVSEFNSNGQLPYNRTGMSECMVSEEAIKRISGFDSLTESADKLKQAPEESGSLTDQVNNAASNQGAQTTQEYTWRGGQLWSDKDGCLAAANDGYPTRYIIEHQYVVDTHTKIEMGGTVHENNSTATNHLISAIESNGPKSEIVQISSIKLGGSLHDGFMSSLVIGMNGMEDPSFSYIISDEAGQVSFSDVGMTRGLYNTSEVVILPNDRTRTKNYSGSVLTGIYRSKGGVAHGEQITYNKQYGDTVHCFENGVIVQTSTCERF